MNVWAIIRKKDGGLLMALPTKWQALAYRKHEYDYYDNATLKIVKCNLNSIS